MDTQFFELDALRSKLLALPLKTVLEIAKQAGVAPSTTQKIRHGHIPDPAFSKVSALCKAVARYEAGLKPPELGIAGEA